MLHRVGGGWVTRKFYFYTTPQWIHNDQSLISDFVSGRGVWIIRMLHRLGGGGWVANEFYCDTTLQGINSPPRDISIVLKRVVVSGLLFSGPSS